MKCWRKQRRRLAAAAETRQASVRSALDRLEGRLSEGGELLTEERLYILSLSPSALLQCLREGQLAPTQVLRAYQAKAIVVTYRVNCITEFIPQAEAWATELEGRGAEGRGLPLYGLPVSVKDTVDVEGLDSTLGLAKNLNAPARTHAAIIHALKAQGAVPFCKTNVPQAVTSIGCSNPVWGATLNPVDTQRGPGGSSGGEGALVGAGGSLVGVGVDVVGGVRVPAHFCGVVALRPTAGRLSLCGVTGRGAPQAGVHPSVGVLGRDVSVVVAAVRAVLEAEAGDDPLPPPVPWRPYLVEGGRPLRVGWCEDDEAFPPTPGCRRAVAVAREALGAAGHTLVAFTPPGSRRAWGLALACLAADQGVALRANLRGEERDALIGRAPELLALPRPLRALLRLLLQDRAPMAAHAMTGRAASSRGLWAVLEERRRLVAEVAAAWRAAGLDALVCPAFPMPAPPLTHAPRLAGTQATTGVYSLVNFPVGVVPVTHETQDDQEKLADYPAHHAALRNVKEATLGAEGLPIGVQVIGLPWQEETVCRVMLDLETQLKRQG
ncbi:hypothetical protein O3P69_019768 [Scylla paramamosain]|uniref:fatty acid amide hydrolase n=1 Tax=Scylla paramamosain TaxID=85552 RepID=A0AAW0SXR4_SCYPA